MALTVNQRLAQEAVRRRLYLSRFSTGQANRLAKLIAKLPPRIVPDLLIALEGATPANMNGQRLLRIERAIQKTIAQAYADVFDDLNDTLSTLAKVETNYHLVALEQVIPQSAQQYAAVQSVSFAQTWAAVNAKPFQGKLLKEWATQVPKDAVKQMTSAVSNGVLQGKPTMQILREVTGTARMNYTDGMIGNPVRGLQAVIKTAISHVAAEARELVGQANNDLIKAREWLSTLDSHTSTMCIVRDRLMYSMDKEPKPIGHSIPYGAGPGKLHFCCRSTETWVLKSWKELGVPELKLTEGERASMNGTVPGSTNYRDWIATQPAWVQDDVLGVTRATLLRQGKADVGQFYNDKGEFINLQQLKLGDRMALDLLRSGE